MTAAEQPSFADRIEEDKAVFLLGELDRSH